jgi:hypothetical protein
VFPTVTAKVTFQAFSWEKSIADSKFIIPPDYSEDPYRFPDLWYFLELTLIHILTSLAPVSRRRDTWLPDDGSGDREYVAVDIPLTNLGDSSSQMTLLF